MSGPNLVGVEVIEDRAQLVADVVTLAEGVGDAVLSRRHLAELLSDETLERLRVGLLMEYVGFRL